MGAIDLTRFGRDTGVADIRRVAIESAAVTAMQQGISSQLGTLLHRMGPSEQHLLENKALYLAIRSRKLGKIEAQYATLVNWPHQYEQQPLRSMVDGNQVELVLVASDTATAVRPLLLLDGSSEGTKCKNQSTGIN